MAARFTMLVVISILLLAASCNMAHAFSGTVIKVHDGDTVEVLNEKGKPEKVRLYVADSPELAYRIPNTPPVPTQPYAVEAKASLSELCQGQRARVQRKGVSYGRTVGVVFCNGTNAARYQIHNGSAWVYKWTPVKAYRAEQTYAQKHKLGLWATPTPIEPLQWRKGVRHE